MDNERPANNISRRKTAYLTVGFLLMVMVGAFLLLRESEQSPTSYQECVTRKSAKILQSFPEQCVYDGKTFVNDTTDMELDTEESLCPSGACGEVDEAEPSEGAGTNSSQATQ